MIFFNVKKYSTCKAIRVTCIPYLSIINIRVWVVDAVILKSKLCKQQILFISFLYPMTVYDCMTKQRDTNSSYP